MNQARNFNQNRKNETEKTKEEKKKVLKNPKEREEFFSLSLSLSLSPLSPPLPQFIVSTNKLFVSKNRFLSPKKNSHKNEGPQISKKKKTSKDILTTFEGCFCPSNCPKKGEIDVQKTSKKTSKDILTPFADVFCPSSVTFLFRKLLFLRFRVSPKKQTVHHFSLSTKWQSWMLKNLEPSKAR